MKTPTKIGQAAENDMNSDDTVPPDANINTGSSKTAVSFTFQARDSAYPDIG